MYKRTLVAIGVAGILMVSGSIAAQPASALTIEDVQSQIKELLAKIAELTSQLNTLQNQSGGVPSTQAVQNIISSSAVSIAPHRICALLTRSLREGTRGDDVHGLQEFLKDEGFFSVDPTGYFGPLTKGALARWQASQGVDSVGVAGPITRERIRVWCGKPGEGGGGNTERFNAEPQRGVAPLTVTFTTNVTLANPAMIADAGDYKVVFGDGSAQKLSCTSTSGTCPGPHRVAHTYTSNGTYTATLVHYGYFGLAASDGGLPESIVGKVAIYVGSDIGCTKEYKPVCGSKQIVCITTPCTPVQQTYNNRCLMEADGATFLYEGQCRADTTDPASDPRCRAWYDGCNDCSRDTPSSPIACTLRACIWKAPAYCKEYFDNSVNQPPTISGFSGPTTLEAGQTGVWTIDVSDPEGGRLSYQISWGDETQYVPLADSATAAREFVQTSTFTHSYRYVGTYPISVVIRDESGGTVRAGTSVRVGGDRVTCTYEYAPVCGQPPEPACRYSTPACLIPTPGPQTYGNRCFMNTAGAALLYEGACRTNKAIVCTADAKLCPNGTYVGRTGPNCEFICPTSAISNY